MRTPDQVVADLRKAEKALEDAKANHARIIQELSDMASYVNTEFEKLVALTPKPVLVHDHGEAERSVGQMAA